MYFIYFIIRLPFFLLGIILWVALGLFVYLPLWLIEWLFVPLIFIGDLLESAFKNNTRILRESTHKLISDLTDQFVEYWKTYDDMWCWLFKNGQD